jgi:hypothetical protein
VSKQLTVSTDGLESWLKAVHRAEHGETAAAIAHGEHVAYVVSPGELDRLRKMIEVLSIRSAIPRQDPD